MVDAWIKYALYVELALSSWIWFTIDMASAGNWMYGAIIGLIIACHLDEYLERD